MRALRMLRARLRPLRVPKDGRPLDGVEWLALMSLRRAWDDKAATRALAAQEQRAELTARRRTGRRT
jgi:hypothetical protein